MFGSQYLALTTAIKAHQHQTRKGGEPYVLHPLRVMDNLQNHFSPNILRGYSWAEVALLHDVIEDTNVTAAQLRDLFPQHVVEAVMEVTDDQTLSKGARKRAQLEHTPHYSSLARWVKMADILDNLRDRLRNPGLFDRESNAAYFGWKFAIYRKFVITDADSSLRAELFGVFMEAEERGIWKFDDATPEALERYFAAEDAKK